MRDDIIIVWKQGDIEFDRFYCYLMAIEPRIKFTMEWKKMESFLSWTFTYKRKRKDW